MTERAKTILKGQAFQDQEISLARELLEGIEEKRCLDLWRSINTTEQDIRKLSDGDLTIVRLLFLIGFYEVMKEPDWGNPK